MAIRGHSVFLLPGKEVEVIGERRDINREILEKMEVEYGRYVNDLLGKKPEEIIKSSYETVIRDEILFMIEGNYFSHEQMMDLLSFENPLEICTTAWKECNEVDTEEIRESVDEYLQELKDDMKRKEEELMINNNDISFEIVEHIGVISQNQHGWAKELNVVSWNGKRPKFDIRDWSPDHTHMSRGLTLSEHEMKNLKDIVADKDLTIPAGSRDKKEKDYER